MSDDDKLNQIYNTVKDLQQTIRGFNGYEGLVSHVARIEEKQNSISKSLIGLEEIKEDINQIRTLTDVINHRGCAFGQSSGVHTPTQPIKQGQDNDDNVKWKELREKLFWPIVVALVISVIHAIPDILAALSNLSH